MGIFGFQSCISWIYFSFFLPFSFLFCSWLRKHKKSVKMAANTMDAIKKKMQAMKLEKEGAMDKADQLEQQLTDQKDKNTKQEEEMGDLQKRISALEGDLDTCQTQLEEANQKLENTEKQLANSESEVQALTRRIRLLEEDFEQTETRLQTATEKLEEASKAADESERGRKVLEGACQG